MSVRVKSNEQSLAFYATYERQSCPDCGTVWYWPDTLDYEARNRRRSFWCPACGQSLSYSETEAQRLRKYSETEAQRLRKQLDAEKERTTFLRDEEQRQREHRHAAERRVTAMKGVVTRTKNRVAKGLCVRCSEQFPDLAAHMAENHPGYAPGVDAP